jgi:hypothetical protein
MGGKRIAKRRLLLTACAWASALGAACWSGEAPRVVDRVAGSAAVQSAARGEPAARLSSAVLTDADLAAVAAAERGEARADVAPPGPAPSPVAGSTTIAAPLPPELMSVLESDTGHGPIDATHDLAISVADSSREIVETALDGPSVLEEPLSPAAPAPDLYGSRELR